MVLKISEYRESSIFLLKSCMATTGTASPGNFSRILTSIKPSEMEALGAIKALFPNCEPLAKLISNALFLKEPVGVVILYFLGL